MPQRVGPHHSRQSVEGLEDACCVHVVPAPQANGTGIPEFFFYFFLPFFFLFFGRSEPIALHCVPYRPCGVTFYPPYHPMWDEEPPPLRSPGIWGLFFAKM